MRTYNTSDNKAKETSTEFKLTVEKRGQPRDYRGGRSIESPGYGTGRFVAHAQLRRRSEGVE